MDGQIEILTIIRIATIAVMGAVVGFYPIKSEEDIDTKAIVAITFRMCIVWLVTTFVSLQIDNRIEAQIAFACGFFGAEIVRRERGRAKGLTLSTLWTMGAAGLTMIVGFNLTRTTITTMLQSLYSLHQLPGWFN